jgi:Mor family transcriptional regulator
MVLFYIGQKASMVPLTDHTSTKHRRNEQIRRRYERGETVIRLAAAFGLSEQRISQIFRGRRR